MTSQSKINDIKKTTSKIFNIVEGAVMKKQVTHITLDDWYDLCESFREKTNGTLSWSCGFVGWDFDDGEALKINRDFLKHLNEYVKTKGAEEGAKMSRFQNGYFKFWRRVAFDDIASRNFKALWVFTRLMAMATLQETEIMRGGKLVKIKPGKSLRALRSCLLMEKLTCKNQTRSALPRKKANDSSVQ